MRKGLSLRRVIAQTFVLVVLLLLVCLVCNILAQLFLPIPNG